MNRRELQHALSSLSSRERAELAKLILQGLTPDDLELSVNWPELLLQREVKYRVGDKSQGINDIYSQNVNIKDGRS
jgi:hypothetical protein